MFLCLTLVIFYHFETGRYYYSYVKHTLLSNCNWVKFIRSCSRDLDVTVSILRVERNRVGSI
jgi:hypothetical protein